MRKHLFGCQTYSWQMSFDRFGGEISQIAATVRRAGFQGIEAEVVMLGETYFSDWGMVKELMDREGLEFAALALPQHWVYPQETEEEYLLAQRAIEFVSHFPQAKLVLCHLPLENRVGLKQRRKNHIGCILDVARRADEKGVLTAFHPNSAPGSVFRTREDYEVLMDGIWKSSLGYAPDAGHIANGNMDPLAVIKAYHEKVNHIHFKDMSPSHQWKSMGEGCIDFKAIVSYLDSVGYDQWIIVEEESEEAEVDPDRVTLQNGAYVRQQWMK